MAHQEGCEAAAGDDNSDYPRLPLSLPDYPNFSQKNATVRDGLRNLCVSVNCWQYTISWLFGENLKSFSGAEG